ncbi:type VII secretion protein EssA [Staphylococcus simulans]|uniref:type VII secretion protein EssA n=1 Tax=Staphylococcus simulans TaxID=1286 RepID=UPI000D0989FB|nr:type VII secretion protein EssA [Staphylococcus simulans]AVO03101.1 type VII secretion protein EssA [Staphylococcus simulans]AVO06056.1 type VII secretion protein EssA [Staphylococcus simulans]AWG19649.1 type VII secretion protein EssA [Staphylococcus simulans]AWI02598.1 type VII secretion protein EssA [Staphylococcus simulans]
MIATFLLTGQLWLGQVDNHNGSLEINVQSEETTENKNKDLNQYDTSLFNEDSKTINNKLKENRIEKVENIKNEMFKQTAGQTSHLNETKRQIFTSNSHTPLETNKVPYHQKNTKKNMVSYIMISFGLLFMTGFIWFTLIQRRKRGKL